MTLKILFVIDGLWVGGTERSLAELLPVLTKANIKPIIACFTQHPQEGVEEDVLKLGIDVRVLENSGLILQAWALRRLVRTEQPDLIHTALFKANLIGRLATIRLPVPILNSLTNIAYEKVRFQDPNIKRMKLRIVQVIDSWTARHLTTHFHAVSNAVKESAMRNLKIPPESISVVERGRDPTRLGQPSTERRLRARQHLGLRAADEVIVHIGRHEYAKGQLYLLEAIASLARTRPRLVLLVAGRTGHFTGRLESTCNRLGLNGRVSFLGHRNDVPEILTAADLFVFPSLYEGLPGAVIEAMALSLPIVASKIAPVQEVVEEGRNALLIEPSSSNELSAAIEGLLEDRQKAAAFGKRSREIFEERFTIERSASRMIELYHRVAAMKHSRLKAQRLGASKS